MRKIVCRKFIVAYLMATLLVSGLAGIWGVMSVNAQAPEVSIASGYDTTAPVVNNITFQQSIVKPGILKISINVTEEETGIIGIVVNFTNGTFPCAISYGTLDLWEKNPHFSGTYEFSIPISSKIQSGEYYLYDIQMVDMMGNGSEICFFKENEYEENPGWYKLNGSQWESIAIDVNGGSNILSVEDEFDVGFQYYITNPDITAKLKQMKDGLTAMINFDDNNCSAKKEWFDAIKGTKKGIVFSNDGVQWIFHGKDITTTKDINCAINMDRMDPSQYGSSDQVLKLEFASNGQLPGKATVRVKSDYIYNLSQLSNTMYLYYLNDDQSLALEDNPKYILDGTDHWCEFEVAHNSTFLVSGKKLLTQMPIKKVTDINLDNTTLLLEKGKSAILKAIVSPPNATDNSVEWNSSNTKVATVSSGGKVTAKGIGTATITATATDGSKKKAVCKVTVGYKVTYRMNGGTNNEKNPSVYYNQKVTLKKPVKKGYIFKGWYLDKKCKNKILGIAKNSKKDLTLYAKWQKISVSKASIISIKNYSRKKVVLKYKKVSDASGYEIMYGMDKKFKKNHKITTAKKTSVTLKGLAKNKTYYVKVRAYKKDSAGKKVYGKYSTAVSVKISK